MALYPDGYSLLAALTTPLPLKSLSFTTRRNQHTEAPLFRARLTSHLGRFERKDRELPFRPWWSGQKKMPNQSAFILKWRFKIVNLFMFCFFREHYSTLILHLFWDYFCGTQSLFPIKTSFSGKYTLVHLHLCRILGGFALLGHCLIWLASCSLCYLKDNLSVRKLFLTK